MTSQLPLWVSDVMFLIGVGCVLCCGALVFGVWWSGRCDRRAAGWRAEARRDRSAGLPRERRS